MRTKYFKITRPEEYWWTPTYYKVIENKESATELSIFPGSIDYTLDTGDTFEERIEFIYDRKMDREKITEVDRQEFDEKYIEYIKPLNELAKC